MNAEYWADFAREYNLRMSPIDLETRFNDFYQGSWRQADIDRFVSTFEGPRLSNPMKYWKNLARENGIPQSLHTELMASFHEWISDGRAWDPKGQQAFVEKFRGSIKGLPVGVKTEWIDFAQQHGISMEYVSSLQRRGDSFREVYGWRPSQQADFVEQFKFGTKDQQLFDPDFTVQKPIGEETGFSCT